MKIHALLLCILTLFLPMVGYGNDISGVEVVKEPQVDKSGEYGGIGIIVDIVDGAVKVTFPTEDSPASHAGIKSGDVIIKVDNTLLKGMTLSDAINLLRGQPGSKVVLTIIRNDEQKPLEIAVVRTVIKPFANNGLLSAVNSGSVDEVRRLLAGGANINSRDRNGLTALHAAVSWGFNPSIAYVPNVDLSAKYIAIAELLIAEGASINATGAGIFKEWTPLDIAASYGFKDAAELLIAHGADIEPQNQNGPRPLDIAAVRGHKNVVELMISKGSDVNLKRADGWTTLLASASTDRKDVVELLIDKGADVNAKNDEGWTPLHFVAHNNSMEDAEVVVMLIMKGANVSAKNRQGQTPFDIASINGDKNFAALFSETKNNIRPNFDCSNYNALSYIETEICSFPPLTNLDRKLNAAYVAALKTSTNPKRIKDEQREWLGKRNEKCSKRSPDCSILSIMEMYNLQIDALNNLERNAGSNNTCSNLAELADRKELKDLAIKADINKRLTTKEEEQLKNLSDWSYQNISTLYELQLNPKKPPVKFVEFFTGGSCASTQIYNLKSILSSNGQSTGWTNVNDPDEIIRWAYWGGGDYPIRYKDRYYMVTADLSDANSINMISAIKPDGSILPVCMVEKASFEYVVSSGGDSLCSNIAKEIVKPMEWEDGTDEISIEDRREYANTFGGFADSVDELEIDLDGDGTAENIGRFTYNSGAGCGSQQIWGRVLTEDSSKVVDGNLNRLVSQFGRFEIYEIDKHYYIRNEIAKDKEAVIQIIKGKVEKICELQKISHSKPKLLFEAIIKEN
jgi:ankyrin repeat protein